MFVKKRISPETIEVLGTKVLLITQDYSKPETFIQYGEPLKEFKTNINFMTTASSESKYIKLEDYEFTETTHIFIDFIMHRLIEFDLPAMKLNELVFNISKIYTEIFYRFNQEAEICCDGYDFLYLEKVKVHPYNVISLKIYQKIIDKKTKISFKSFFGKLFKKNAS